LNGSSGQLLFLPCLQIADGEIFATINQRDGMVSFHDNPEKHDSAGMLKRLDVEVSALCSFV
jgi:hypothetical protein